MSRHNPYLLPNSEYKRDFKMMHHFVNDAATYLSVMRNTEIEAEKKWVKLGLKDGTISYSDPDVFLLFKENADTDRVKRKMKMSQLMREVANRKMVMAATLTTYAAIEEDESELAGYTLEELDNRGKNKKEMFKYAAIGDAVNEAIYNNRQNRNKIKVNSLSGAQGTKSSVLYDSTAHSTLTTTCRSATSNANANAERLSCGNRHYWSTDTAINNIINIINNADEGLITRAIAQYNIALPSADYTWEVVKSSMDYYIKGDSNRPVKDLIYKLTPMQRAIYLYTGDLWSLKNNNEELIRDLFQGLGTACTEGVDNPQEYIDLLDEEEEALLLLVCGDYFKFRELKDEGLRKSPEYKLIGATAKKIIETGEKYELLFKAFILTHEPPPCIAKFPTSVRRCVVGSDTDSSIFTNQHWTRWYLGGDYYNSVNAGISAAMTFIIVKSLSHLLVLMSRNLGISDKYLRSYVMKNEFAFGVFGSTTMAKHYYAIQDACEGLVYAEPKFEIKGAGMRNSKAPIDVIEDANELIKTIIRTIKSESKLDIKAIINHCVDIEMRVYDGILHGKPEYFSREAIKPPTTYKDPINNPKTRSKRMWNEVFAPKYGNVSVEPYISVKVNIGKDSVNKIRTWVDTFEDKEIAARLMDWVRRENRKSIGTLYIPMEAMLDRGIPEEVIQHINIRSMIMASMKTHYLILESLGIYLLNKNITKVLIEEYRGIVLGE